MILDVTIVMCSWCKKPLPPKIEGVEGLIPPGKHPATIQVSHGICPDCAARNGVPQADTVER